MNDNGDMEDERVCACVHAFVQRRGKFNTGFQGYSTIFGGRFLFHLYICVCISMIYTSDLDEVTVFH